VGEFFWLFFFAFPSSSFFAFLPPRAGHSARGSAPLRRIIQRKMGGTMARAEGDNCLFCRAVFRADPRNAKHQKSLVPGCPGGYPSGAGPARLIIHATKKFAARLPDV